MDLLTTPLKSMELWAASKIIGRECSTVNKEFFVCKKNSSDPHNPSDCEAQSALASLCAVKVIDELKKDYNTEFAAFQSCLDNNDYRYADCRKTERALLHCWNKRNGL
jgi:hypothetical protein